MNLLSETDKELFIHHPVHDLKLTETPVTRVQLLAHEVQKDTVVPENVSDFQYVC
jgi:hypothetical protein